MIRTPNVQVKIDRWEWNEDRTANLIDSTDITSKVLGYSWQKSIKNPSGSASINVFPSHEGHHLLDAVSTMDVVRIWEFGTLKFQGFIRNISYSGSIQRDGTPQRNGVIDVTEMIGLLMETAISFNLGFIDPDQADQQTTDLIEASGRVFETVVQAGENGEITYSEIVQTIIDEWLGAVTDMIDATGYRNYFDTYIDYTLGLSKNAAPGLPRDLNKLFTGMEEQLTMWDILQKLIEAPFHEIWSDEGPRHVSIDGTPTYLSGETSYLIMRKTPFNGAIPFTGGAEEQRFDELEERKIPLDYLVSFNLSRTMDEAYSVFFAVPVALQLNQKYAAVAGNLAINNYTLTRRLYRPMQYNLYYIRSGEDVSKSDTEFKARNASWTLKQWFENNSRYLNGTIRMMVPDEKDTHDIRIGEKASIEGIKGQFYVESVSHKWQYQSTLSADIGLTRGYNYDNGPVGEPVELVNSIFSRPTS